MNYEEGKSLFSALADNLSAEALCLASLQGIIAAEISLKRLELGLNQKQFAKFMGVSQGLVSRWESGETNFTLSTLVDIASKLDIKMQCPFVTAPPPVYRTAKPKVISFSDYTNTWSSFRSESGRYENAEELLEM